MIASCSELQVFVDHWAIFERQRVLGSLKCLGKVLIRGQVEREQRWQGSLMGHGADFHPSPTRAICLVVPEAK